MSLPDSRPTLAEVLTTVILASLLTLTAAGVRRRRADRQIPRRFRAAVAVSGLRFVRLPAHRHDVLDSSSELVRDVRHDRPGLLPDRDASLYYQNRIETGFIIGSSSFLVAHIAFIMAFFALRASRRDPGGEYACGARHGFFGAFSWCRLAVSIPVMVLITVGLAFWILPGVEKPAEIVLVVAYMAVITTMVIFSGGIRDTRMRAIVFLAAILFYISDIFVAEWRFVKVIGDCSYYCYPLYYSACLLFAWSVGVKNLSRKSGVGTLASLSQARILSVRLERL